MILREWEIWHTFSTFLGGRIIGLDSVAREMVESGIASCVMLHDGKCHWRAESGIKSGLTSAKMNPASSRATFKIITDDGAEPDFTDFAREAWFQATRFRFNELRLFGEHILNSHPYARAFLGKCTFITLTDEHEVHVSCYPVLKLYESGVLVVEFRIIGSQEGIEVKEFIDQYVNLFREEFERIEVPPAISRLAPSAYTYYTQRRQSLRDRVRFQKSEQQHSRAIEQLTEIEEDGDFTFNLAPLPSTIAEDGEPETITSLALTIFSVVGFIASRPRKGIPLLLLGQRRLLQLGDYWIGRPHIHIVRHDEQAETASKNEGRHRQAFGWILARVPGYKPESALKFLPHSSRSFEDYSAYITSAASLWVWSKRGHRADQEWADANRGHLIYPNQATVELLEYGYMLHRSLAESVATTKSSAEILRVRKALARLKSQLRQPSYFGEITDLLRDGWERMGVLDLREDVSEALSINETAAALAEARASERMSKALTVLFGLIAVPPVASEIIAPVWDLLSLWRPGNPATAKLFMIAVAVGLVSIFICILWVLLPRRKD